MTTAIGGSVTIGGETVRLERVSSRKASRALALLRHINKAVPGLTHKWAEAESAYRATHVRRMTRAEARLEFPPRPAFRTGPDGLAELIYDDATGAPVLVPSPVDTISEADWEASDGYLELPEDPPNVAPMVAAVFDEALELAESHVVRLLTLFTLRNEDVARLHKEGRLDEELERQGERLLDESFADELLELAVPTGELVDDQFTRKVRELGSGRLGNALRLVGIGKGKDQPTSPSATRNGPSGSTPSSSTDGPASSDGRPTSPSTPSSPSSTASESSPSASSPTEKPSETA